MVTVNNKSITPKIDKLSITYHIHGMEKQLIARDNIKGAIEYDEEGWEVKDWGSDFYRNTYRFPITKDKRHSLLVQIGPYRPNIPFVRLEWNPDKVGKEGNWRVQEIVNYLDMDDNYLGFFANGKISRCDICLDIPGLKVDNLQIFAPRIRKWGVFGSNKIETHYIGSKTSSKFFRIYDKKKQLIEEENADSNDLPHDLTRFEVTLKKAGISLLYLCGMEENNPFNELEVTDTLNTDNYKYDFFFAYAQLHGAARALKKIPNAKTRRKYRDVLEASEELQNIWKPEEYWKNFSDYICDIGLFPFQEFSLSPKKEKPLQELPFSN